MQQLVIAALGFLWPLSNPNDPPDVYRWRVSVSIALYILIGVSVMHIALAFGLLGAVLGFSGFADAAVAQQERLELRQSVERLGQTIQERFDASEAQQLVTTILMLRTRECTAIKQKRGDDARDLRERIAVGQTRYQRLSGLSFPPLDPC